MCSAVLGTMYSIILHMNYCIAGLPLMRTLIPSLTFSPWFAYAIIISSRRLGAGYKTTSFQIPAILIKSNLNVDACGGKQESCGPYM